MFSNLGEDSEQFLVVWGMALRVAFHAGEDLSYRTYMPLPCTTLRAGGRGIENSVHGVVSQIRVYLSVI